MSTDNRCMYTFSDGQLVYVVCTIQERNQYTTTRRTNEPIDAARNGDNETHQRMGQNQHRANAQHKI